jgi:hypothetical protein
MSSDVVVAAQKRVVASAEGSNVPVVVKDLLPAGLRGVRDGLF